jgi:AAA domain
MAVRTFDPQPIFMNVLPNAIEWAVDGYIPEEGITCILGKPGSGKTFGMIDAACCMATGLDCWGRRVGPPRKVTCIAAEAATAVKLRIIAWIESHRDALEEAEVELVIDEQGRESLPNLLLWPKAVNLHKPSEVYKAIKDIEELGLKADVLCVDTLFASSAGATLTLPEELLPVLEQLQRLMEALGVKTCLLVHHTNKKGEEYYGTIAFLATIEAMILFKVKDKTTLTVECIRIRDGEKFKPFELKLLNVVVKTRPDKFGRDEQGQMAVSPGLAQRPTQKEEDLDFMEWVLAVQLGNRAPYASWRDEVIRLTPQKTDRKTGELKAGISEKTFDRRLKVIVEERGNAVLTTDGQGGTYSVVRGRWASGEGTVTVNRQISPHRGERAFDGDSGGRQPPSATVISEIDGSSTDDLIKKALSQLG